MPVIRDIAVDPTDIVLQGEQFRSTAVASPVATGWFGGIALPDVEYDRMSAATNPLIAVDQALMSMGGKASIHPTREILRNPYAGTMVAANACISTPCGAIIPFDRGGVLLERFVEASVLWSIPGTTVDGSDVALPGCRVVARDAGRLGFDGVEGAVVETISDGSGAYAVSVPLNVAYQLTAYLPGSPDVAGITLDTVMPDAVG